MKRISLAVVSALMFAVPAAHAADMALKAPPPPPAPVWSWTGFYIGANAGGGWATTDWQHNHLSTCPGKGPFNVASCDIGNQSSISFIGGGQVGARWQTGQFVLGIEAMADYARFSANTTDPQGLAIGFNFVDSTQLKGLYTVTGQAGIAWNQALWFVKGGWAGSRVTQTLTEITNPNVGQVSHSANGWTVGTGIDYRLTSLPNFSIGIEYDYIRLSAGDTSTCVTAPGFGFSCPAPATPLLFNGFRANINEVLVRANYNFNWAAH